MRKSLLLVILSFCCFAGFSQDACSKAYSEALQSFGKGNYEDAQRKFIAVAQTCTNFTDVWKYLTECNKKILEKQKQQAMLISTLNKEKEQLGATKDSIESVLNANCKMLSESVGRIKNIQTELENAQESLRAALSDINSLRKDTTEMFSEIRSLKEEKDNLQTKLEECTNTTNDQCKENLKRVEAEKKEIENEKEVLNVLIEQLQQQIATLLQKSKK